MYGGGQLDSKIQTEREGHRTGGLPQLTRAQMLKFVYGNSRHILIISLYFISFFVRLPLRRRTRTPRDRGKASEYIYRCQPTNNDPNCLYVMYGISDLLVGLPDQQRKKLRQETRVRDTGVRVHRECTDMKN